MTNHANFFAPAKINLFLAVTGKRADGFHDLVSVAAPLAFGDTLRVEPDGAFSLACSDPEVPVDETNLVLKAARAFAAQTGWRGGAKFFLEKRIPMGAGLGGGSSDAVAALRATNTLAGTLLAEPAITEIAMTLGADCPLFLQAGPVVMRGRGERIETLPPQVAARLQGRRLLVFKPGFGIATPWAYGAMAARPEYYLPADEAEEGLKTWMDDETATAEKILSNNMEHVAFEKFVALPALLGQLRAEFALEPRMSGSGSACFALLRNEAPVAAITQVIHAAWGASAFVTETTIR